MRLIQINEQSSIGERVLLPRFHSRGRNLLFSFSFSSYLLHLDQETVDCTPLHHVETTAHTNKPHEVKWRENIKPDESQRTYKPYYSTSFIHPDTETDTPKKRQKQRHTGTLTPHRISYIYFHSLFSHQGYTLLQRFCELKY